MKMRSAWKKKNGRVKKWIKYEILSEIEKIRKWKLKFALRLKNSSWIKPWKVCLLSESSSKIEKHSGRWEKSIFSMNHEIIA